MKVKVYFNLHRKLFSVVALEGPRKGLVIAHENRLILTNPTFKVSEAGRQRVLRERRKNVHAFVVGEWYPGAWFEPNDYSLPIKDVTYNPYLYSTFVLKSNQEPISECRTAWLSGKTLRVV